MFRPHWVCPAQGCLCFPRLHCSGSRPLYMERALRCVRFQPSGVPQKPGTESCACFLRHQSGSGSQGLDGRTLPGCGAPSALRGPGPSPRPRPPRLSVPEPSVSLQPSRRMSTIQNLRRSLNRDWRPVCSAVGAAVLGAEPAPSPSPLPPVSGGAGLVRSLRALLWTCLVPLFCEWPTV